jgi:hypothetical protein
MKRLIKKAIIYEGFNNDDYGDDVYYEVFKNPSAREISDTLNNDHYESIRGVIYNDGTIYIWPGSFVHDDINSHLKNAIDINNGLRFSWDGSCWTIDCAHQYSTEQAKQLIKDNKSVLDRIGNINREFFLFFTNDGKKETVFKSDEIFNPKAS